MKIQHVYNAIQEGGAMRCDFLNVEGVELPSRLGNGNMAWPPGTTEEQACYWRAMMEIPGATMREYANPVFMPDWFAEIEEERRRKVKRELRRQWLHWALLPWRA